MIAKKKTELETFPGVEGKVGQNCVPVMLGSYFSSAQNTDTVRQSVSRVAQGFCVKRSGVFICIETCVSPCLG